MISISESSLESAKTASYLPYSKEGDLIEPLKVGSEYESKMLTKLADKVDHMVGPLQKDLERAIAARSLSSWEAGRRSGRLHAANLSRLTVGDGRVFRKRHEVTGKDVAVELVIDASGSMSGAKIHLATQAAYALSSVLERIGIANEVICFTTHSDNDIDHRKMSADAKKIGRGWTRHESLYMPVLKSFDERLSTMVRSRFGWLPHSSIFANNIDGECVEIAARRLLARREAGKIMMVLSDGQPACHGDMRALKVHLKSVINEATKAGINTVGIGIHSSAVSSYYPKSLVINNVEDLPKTVVKELRELLLAK